MRVCLIQLDGPIMNLALGKIASYHISKGDVVGLGLDEPDRVYRSAIFSETANAFRGQRTLHDCPTIDGGYAFNDCQLPRRIEYLRPAYSVWGVDYSLGYTSRGCIRKCAFCVVPRMEGEIHNNQPIEAFHDPGHKRLILLDNNFFASPNWRSNIQYIQDNGLRVNFNQGLDARIMTPEVASIIADLKYYDWKFRNRAVHFAWDQPEEEARVCFGLKMLLDAGVNPEHIFVYVLVGFNSTFEEDLYRCNTLIYELGVHPYVMRYDGARGDRRLNALARWANRPANHRHHSFEDYLTQPGRAIA